MKKAPLLMIPGPVEISPAVLAALAVPPPGHVAAPFIEAFGSVLEGMRTVWKAAAQSQPFLIAGGGTVAMDMVAANLTEPGDRVLVVSTGYFSARMAEMLRRQGAHVTVVAAPPGEAPALAAVHQAIEHQGPFRALYATHVDTSTGVRLDPRPLAQLARDAGDGGMLSIFDGVCGTAGERFEMAEWGADVYFTASQKALGAPPGLALLVVSPRALAVRAARQAPLPPMYLDWQTWLPVMRAYEERKPSYFSTPATGLVLALAAALGEILEIGVDRRIAAHQRTGRAMRAAWQGLGLRLVPAAEDLAANTLSAVRFPAGIDAGLVGRVRDLGVVVAGGLHPAIRDEYFRVGHMGYATTQPEMLERTVREVGLGLQAGGWSCDWQAAWVAAQRELSA